MKVLVPLIVACLAFVGAAVSERLSLPFPLVMMVGAVLVFVQLAATAIAAFQDIAAVTGEGRLAAVISFCLGLLVTGGVWGVWHLYATGGFPGTALTVAAVGAWSLILGLAVFVGALLTAALCGIGRSIKEE